jgi:hypothetical protein
MRFLTTCLFFFFFSLLFPLKVFAAPNVTYMNTPALVVIGGEFTVSFSIDSLTASSSYYLKSRIGPGLNQLTKGQTKSDSGSWLSEGDSWSSFPVLSSDESGRISGQISSRVSPSVGEAGRNFYALRILKVGDKSSKAITLGSFELEVVAPTPTSTPVPTETPTPTPEPTATSSPTNTPTLTLTPVPTVSKATPTPLLDPVVTTLEGDVFGDRTGQPENRNSLLTLDEEGGVPEEKDESKDIKELYQPPEKKQSLLFPVLSISGGLAFVGFAIWSFLKQEKTASDMI